MPTSRHSFVIAIAASGLLCVAGTVAQTPPPAATATTSPTPTPAASPTATAAASPGEMPFLGRWRARREQMERNNPSSNRPGAAASNPGSGAEGNDPAGLRPGPALQRFIERLPPADREVFQRNLQRWHNLSPQEREALRGQADARKAQMLSDAQRAMQESGLKLDNDGREMFLLRYSQERRKLERELRQKMDAERTARLPGITEQLRREFSNSGASPSPAPTATPR